jgi:spoIIIJ-associated protein
VEKKFGGDATSFMVDINGYQKKHIDDIRVKANILAERARYFKSAVEMDPMSSYERMIVHSEFASVPDIATESSGTGRDRRIILKYTENKTLS